MAKLQKRSNPPQGMACVSTFSPQGEKCAVCRTKPASRRFHNSYRVIDVCNDSTCALQGSSWASNSPYSKRVDAPLRTFRKPGEFKFLTRRADPLPKPP